MSSIQGLTETLSMSQHCRIEEFKVVLNCAIIMPRDASLSGSGCAIFPVAETECSATKCFERDEKNVEKKNVIHVLKTVPSIKIILIIYA